MSRKTVKPSDRTPLYFLPFPVCLPSLLLCLPSHSPSCLSFLPFLPSLPSFPSFPCLPIPTCPPSPHRWTLASRQRLSLHRSGTTAYRAPWSTAHGDASLDPPMPSRQFFALFRQFRKVPSSPGAYPRP